MRTVNTFTLDNVSLDYHVLREERKTISATVFPSGEVLVKAPLDATFEGMESFLTRRIRWILKQKRYFSQFGPVRSKRYVSGETFQYRGRSYKLLLHGYNDSNRVSLQHGVLNVFMKGQKHPSKAARLVDSWYSVRAKAVFSERLEECFQMFDNNEVPSLALRRMSKRWGSYSSASNQIALNPELVRAATRYIDYVIVHELCHMTQKRHDSAFYELIESKMPTWRRLKTELELRLLG